ncbi:helix-turn-helix domain-containing protein [Phytomonospora endophytica]|uniref:Ribosome-binding protein aMBF1 (Putative translation factor) n=1 Tax=Phytomonospora endophytica TaxID=714109 RepID=A0A841FL12_9ACTN|nr:helix-turn-helix transcriptional regulator [Phytomonospora endophytica]MBB6034242.1 ribosome-binding protein aMBF1 (putative translation factor) [Phytomonospora endophytica]GIG66635.1 hypothetical protein Pen01_29300 [Phytomonospora endophytica]
MAEHSRWEDVRDRAMTDPKTQEGYRAAQLAYELGIEVRRLRLEHGWSQSQLAERAEMTQSAVARMELGGTTPTLPVLSRLATAFDRRLTICFESVEQPA